MRVVVTGGAGFVGSHLVERLLAEGHSVTVVDNCSTGRLDNIKHLLTNDNFTFFKEDTTEPLVIEGPVDAVCHLASPASPTDFPRIPVAILRAGSLGTMNALELARQGAGLGAAEETPSTERLQAELPTDVALVDFLEYACSVPPEEEGSEPASSDGGSVSGQWYPPHVVAFVVRSSGPVIRLDLGPAEPIHEAIDAWRRTYGQAGASVDADADALQHLLRLLRRQTEPPAQHTAQRLPAHREDAFQDVHLPPVLRRLHHARPAQQKKRRRHLRRGMERFRADPHQPSNVEGALHDRGQQAVFAASRPRLDATRHFRLRHDDAALEPRRQRRQRKKNRAARRIRYVAGEYQPSQTTFVGALDELLQKFRVDSPAREAVAADQAHVGQVGQQPGGLPQQTGVDLHRKDPAGAFGQRPREIAQSRAELEHGGLAFHAVERGPSRGRQDLPARHEDLSFTSAQPEAGGQKYLFHLPPGQHDVLRGGSNYSFISEVSSPESAPFRREDLILP